MFQLSARDPPASGLRTDVKPKLEVRSQLLARPSKGVDYAAPKTMALLADDACGTKRGCEALDSVKTPRVSGALTKEVAARVAVVQEHRKAEALREIKMEP